jgi:TolB-like protein
MGLVFLLFLLAAPVFAQQRAKPRLGILPFSGGVGGDGETIATLFSFQPEILGAFTVVPRTSAVNAIVAEQSFQQAGYTDSDTIAQLGRQLNADFVVSGHIRKLGDRNLVITTIINVETFEQLAGDYREYKTIEEIPTLLSVISKIVIDASRQDTSKQPKLAIAPFNVANNGVDVRDAEVLAQILSIEISNSGKYIVLPRTTTIQAALKELEIQNSGVTSEEGAKALGQAINAEYVLSAEVRSLGAMNMFTASILHLEDGSQLAGGYRNYRVIVDGLQLMAELAHTLTGTEPGSISKEQGSGAPDKKKPPKEKPPRSARAARLTSLGVSAGTTFTTPLVTGTVHTTLALFPYTFIELGADIGFLCEDPDVEYWSAYPFAHFAIFAPFAQKGGWYIGAGLGYMFGEYVFNKDIAKINIFAIDFTTGFVLGDVLIISDTLRVDTDFATASNKVSLGFIYRFK